MSLVAYGSSDDSDTEETIVATKPHNDQAVTSNPILGSGSNNSVNTDNSISQVENPSTGHISDSDNEESTAHTGGDIGQDEDLFKRLPTPKDQMGGVMEETDELEDEVKPKPSQVADAPKPPAKKSRQPVKITIPALPDSDEEECPVQKKPKIASGMGKIGLFAMLPAPAHAPKKEANRILLPYSLNKKPKPATENVHSLSKANSVKTSENKIAKPLAGLASYEDSDSDDNDADGSASNFFSLDSSAPNSKPLTSLSTVADINKSSVLTSLKSSVKQSASLLPAVKASGYSVTSVPTVMPAVSQRTSLTLPAPVKSKVEDISDVPSPYTGESSTSGKNNDGVSVSTVGEGVGLDDGDSDVVGLGVSGGVFGQPVGQDAPLTFKGGMQSKLHQSGQAPYSAGEEDAGASGSQSMYYNMQYQGQSQYPDVSDDQALQYDQEFLKMQGKKHRGKEEINIVDVNADDFTAPEDLAKYLSEEQSYQSHNKKDGNQPTAQQKRKHQIHYLAFQAKERELELKNQWSQNKMTKKQTQAKYGF